LIESPLHGKVAVITGAGRGIGLAIGQALGREGCALALCGRKPAGLRSAVREISGAPRVLAEACDVRDPRAVERFFRKIKREFGGVNFLINNAGIAHAVKPVVELPLKVWRNVIDTNLTGLFLCARAALPLMRSGGAIVNNLSIASQRVFPGMSAYNASKHGALGLTDTLREELRSEGIRVLALVPGATATDIWDQFMPQARRSAMMPAEAVAEAVVLALRMPANTAVEEIRLMPPRGTI
jgi:NAD(P)-dependent dehydrogenase (short-subunit alcohol dehydrogenase family)